MSVSAELRQQLRELPERAGVYIFKDTSGNVLYVGKAISLKKRVRSYFTTRKQPAKTAALIARVTTIDYYITINEPEALLLEFNLIKQYHPPYNVAFRDDKSYPYIAITTAEKYPRVRYTRERRRRGTRYFGPYTSARSAKETLETLVRIFPIRSCSQTVLAAAERSGTPCLYYHIGRCAGPCIGKVDEAAYTRLTAQIVAFLEGRQEQVIADLRAQMKKAAGELAYEKAAAIRDRIAYASRMNDQQRVSGDMKLNEDAVAMATEADIGCVQILRVRNGKLIGSEDFILDLGWEYDSDRALMSFVKQYYLSGQSDLPKDILLPATAGNIEVLEQVLHGLAGRKVRLIVPKRGRKRGLVAMAEENAGYALERYKISSRHESKQTARALAQVGEAAGLDGPPALIECFDISNISGTSAVGSMVVFESGLARKKLYRRFAIRTVEGANDYAMMKEVLSRRVARLRLDPSGRFSIKPDLIIVDGGRPQLRAAADALAAAGVADIPVVGLAKKEEEIYRLDSEQTFKLPPGPGLYLVQRIRDEAHRFAVEYHRGVRGRGMRASALDSVPGIGPRRKSALLKRFGSLRSIAEATPQDVAVSAGVNLRTATDVIAAARMSAGKQRV